MKSTINFSSEQLVLNDRYIIEDTLGVGKTSIVYKCLDNKTGEAKAVKIYLNNDFTEFEKEVKIIKTLSEINSPHLIRCYDSGIGTLRQNETTQKKMYFILELGNHGTLIDAVFKTENGFSEDVCKYMLLQILNGADALHKEGICHRDLKPENIVLCGDNHDLKLCDFGYSTKYINKKKYKEKVKRNSRNKLLLCSRNIRRKKYDGVKVDIFSIGALLFILMRKKYAFEEAAINNISLKIEKYYISS